MLSMVYTHMVEVTYTVIVLATSYFMLQMTSRPVRFLVLIQTLECVVNNLVRLSTFSSNHLKAIKFSEDNRLIR